MTRYRERVENTPIREQAMANLTGIIRIQKNLIKGSCKKRKRPSRRKIWSAVRRESSSGSSIRPESLKNRLSLMSRKCYS